jgi:hypothetical protein
LSGTRYASRAGAWRLQMRLGGHADAIELPRARRRFQAESHHLRRREARPWIGRRPGSLGRVQVFPKIPTRVAGPGASMVDIARLEALLLAAARAPRSLTYSEVLAHFSIRITPRWVYALCRDLGAVCERNRARGEPGARGAGGAQVRPPARRRFLPQPVAGGRLRRPATGPAAQAFIRRETERVFAHWAERPA